MYISNPPPFNDRNCIPGKERAAAPCEVCRKLHQDPPRQEDGLDIQDWWVSQASCTSLLAFQSDILSDLGDEEDYIDEYDDDEESDSSNTLKN